MYQPSDRHNSEKKAFSNRTHALSTEICETQAKEEERDFSSNDIPADLRTPEQLFAGPCVKTSSAIFSGLIPKAQPSFRTLSRKEQLLFRLGL
jgi:hypothetical protein